MKAWLFDVDGVITNPELKKANPELLTKIADFIIQGDIIGFNTGRSLKFIIEEVLKPLELMMNDIKLLEKVFSIGEKGGDWAYYENGKLITVTDNTLKPPVELEKKIKKLIEDKFSEIIFFDTTKKTMLSAEIIRGTDLNRFHIAQAAFNVEAEKLLTQLYLTNFILEPNIIATDIQNIRAGKDLGVQRFLDMIAGLHEPNEFETFGDSPPDLEMYKYLVKNGHIAKFIYVGKKDIENDENIIKTDAKYDEGTLEYLSVK